MPEMLKILGMESNIGFCKTMKSCRHGQNPNDDARPSTRSAPEERLHPWRDPARHATAGTSAHLLFRGLLIAASSIAGIKLGPHMP